MRRWSAAQGGPAELSTAERFADGWAGKLATPTEPEHRGREAEWCPGHKKEMAREDRAAVQRGKGTGQTIIGTRASPRDVDSRRSDSLRRIRQRIQSGGFVSPAS